MTKALGASLKDRLICEIRFRHGACGFMDLNTAAPRDPVRIVLFQAGLSKTNDCDCVMRVAFYNVSLATMDLNGLVDGSFDAREAIRVIVNYDHPCIHHLFNNNFQTVSCSFVEIAVDMGKRNFIG